MALENKLALLTLAGGLPPLLGLAWAVVHFALAPYPSIAVLGTLGIALASAALIVRARIRRRLLTLSSLIDAVGRGEYTMRGAHGNEDDAHGHLVGAINALASTLQRQRINTEEARQLLDKVLQEVDVAIFAFDGDDRLRLANPLALRLLELPAAQALGRSADELDLASLLAGEHSDQLFEHNFRGASGSWRIKHVQQLEAGRCSHLLFVVDLRDALRAEELGIWKRIIQVLSHEVNNSITPVLALSQSASDMLAPAVMADELRQDLATTMDMIQERSQHLRQFVRRYAQLARLPPPNKTLFDLAPLLARLSAAIPDARMIVDLPRQQMPMYGDPVQLERVVINLLKNAHEAMVASGRHTDGTIMLSARDEGSFWPLEIVDEGIGLGNQDNLFVPFYSTKKSGEGIGLVLSRQIAEAHGGSLRLRNRQDRTGCIAELRLPKPTFAVAPMTDAITRS